VLADAVESRNKMIKPDFANRHQSGVVAIPRERLRQTLEISVVRAIDKQWVNPERVGATPHPLRQHPDRIEITYFNRRDDDAIDPRTLGSGDDGVPIRIEFSGIEMAVRVDQHNRSERPLLRLRLFVRFDRNQKIVGNS